MNPRPSAWLQQAGNDLSLADLATTHVLPTLLAELAAAGVDVAPLAELRLNLLSRMATSSRYPEDDTPPEALFDSRDASEAIAVARAVLAFASPA